MEKMKFVLLEDARRAVLNANSKLVWCIDKLPVYTLAKNVEMVVRCKDCKWFIFGFCCVNEESVLKKDMDFCSCGERKDSE